METERMRVRLTLIDEMLGTSSADPELHREYIASKAPDAPSTEEEVAALGVEAMIEKGMTVFPKDEDGNPFLWTYQVKGFFKSACKALKKMPGTLSSKVKAYKQEIDLRIFVFSDADDRTSRRLPIHLSGPLGNCQRPLRASTMQGDRVALANSEVVPKGSTVEFDIIGLGKLDKALVSEWLDYGSLNGLGQWRNSGKGAYCWEELDDNENVVGGNAGDFKAKV